MKKLLLLITVMAMSSISFSMQYYAGKYRPEDENGYKFTTWENGK